MENKKVLNNVDLTKISGGAGDSTIEYIHSNCGGHIICENHGIYHPDVWRTCPKCGRSWHPHSENRIEECEDIYTVVTGKF